MIVVGFIESGFRLLATKERPPPGRWPRVITNSSSVFQMSAGLSPDLVKIIGGGSSGDAYSRAHDCVGMKGFKNPSWWHEGGWNLHMGE
ncbi:hypothetical protein Tco_0752857 [Tanacetum coccineum]